MRETRPVPPINQTARRSVRYFTPVLLLGALAIAPVVAYAQSGNSYGLIPYSPPVGPGFANTLPGSPLLPSMDDCEALAKTYDDAARSAEEQTSACFSNALKGSMLMGPQQEVIYNSQPPCQTRETIGPYGRCDGPSLADCEIRARQSEEVQTCQDRARAHSDKSQTNDKSQTSDTTIWTPLATSHQPDSNYTPEQTAAIGKLRTAVGIYAFVLHSANNPKRLLYGALLDYSPGLVKKMFDAHGN